MAIRKWVNQPAGMQLPWCKEHLQCSDSNRCQQGTQRGYTQPRGLAYQLIHTNPA
jgi:hypothetical protein